MTPKARKALEGSIRKWEGIVCDSKEDHGDQNCPLCKLYNTDEGCNGCPVKKKTGKDWCGDTPYIRWLRLTDHNEDHGISCGRPRDSAQRRAALAMLRFLESLRP